VEGIADYAFVRSLGSGHFGECFVARTPPRIQVDAEYVAVKVFENTGQEAFRRAVRELRAIAAVSSPYLTAMYDAGHQAGTFYYSMEYVPGGSLRSPAIGMDQHAEYIALTRAAQAAQAVHDAGLVHQDVRPGNVMLVSDETGPAATLTSAKLADFGLMQILAPGMAVPGSGDTRSLEFGDPALVNGEEPTPASDVWSLGATLHWAAAGTGLYGELPADPLEALRIVTGKPPEISPALPPEVAELVRACIAENPADRPTAEQVAGRLAALAASYEAHSSESGLA